MIGDDRWLEAWDDRLRKLSAVVRRASGPRRRVARRPLHGETTVRSGAGRLGVAEFDGHLSDVSVDGSGLSIRLLSPTGPFVGADVSLWAQGTHVHGRVAYVALEAGQARVGLSIQRLSRKRVRALA